MQLPRNELGHLTIGISDILQWRDCPTRMEYGMRRHDEGDPPESWSPANAYGSAVHAALAMMEQGATEDEAVQEAFKQFAYWLDVPDMQMLYDDIEIYLTRDELGVETVVAEEDLSFPLFEHNGEQIDFRFRLDRLYRRLDNPAAFLAIDYKSSKWAKSEEEVHGDLQMWSYNVGIVEVYPEIESPGGSLVQMYDQLRFGKIPTHKNHAQRESMKLWLIQAITALIEDDDMAPHFNDWCPWCPLKMDCPVVRYELTDYAQARIAKLAPRKPKMKVDGTPGKQLLPPELDPTRMDEYVEELPAIKTAIRTLEAFQEEVTSTVKQLPAQDRQAYGYTLDSRSRKTLSADALRMAHQALGEEFYYVAGLSEASLERFYGKSDERVSQIMDLAERGSSYTVLRKT